MVKIVKCEGGAKGAEREALEALARNLEKAERHLCAAYDALLRAQVSEAGLGGGDWQKLRRYSEVLSLMCGIIEFVKRAREEVKGWYSG